MTDRELKKLRYLNRHLPELKAEMTKAADRLEAFTAGTSGQVIPDSAEYMRAKLDLFNRERDYRHACSERDRLERFIRQIPDDLTRSIFRLHYVKGYSWQRVAINCGWTDESWPRKLSKKYLAQSEKSDFVALQ